MDNLWTTGAPGPGQKRETPKLPRRIPVFWEIVISAVSPQGAPGWILHGRMAVFRHLISWISSWLTLEALVFWTNLMWQVEREGSMDWLSLLIPLKLVVFCVILVVIYRMMSGWNSIQTLEAPGRSSQFWRSSRCTELGPPGLPPVAETPKLPSFY